MIRLEFPNGGCCDVTVDSSPNCIKILPFAAAFVSIGIVGVLNFSYVPGELVAKGILHDANGAQPFRLDRDTLEVRAHGPQVRATLELHEHQRHLVLHGERLVNGKWERSAPEPILAW